MLQIRVGGLDPAAIMDEITEDIQRRRGLMVLEALRQLKDKSPVFYGFFRANWIPCRDGNSRSLAGSIAGIPPAKAKSDPSVQRARGVQERGAATPFHHVDLDEDLILFNNQVYGPALNDGHSTQAPRNFVDHALETAVKKHS